VPPHAGLVRVLLRMRAPLDVSDLRPDVQPLRHLCRRAEAALHHGGHCRVFDAGAIGRHFDCGDGAPPGSQALAVAAPAGVFLRARRRDPLLLAGEIRCARAADVRRHPDATDAVPRAHVAAKRHEEQTAAGGRERLDFATVSAPSSRGSVRAITGAPQSCAEETARVTSRPRVRLWLQAAVSYSNCSTPLAACSNIKNRDPIVMPFCTFCGAQAPDAARVCISCGTPFGSVDAAPPAIAPLDFTIHGDNLQVARIRLQPGQELYAEAGKMVYKQPAVEWETRMSGDTLGDKILGALKRTLMGESLFLTYFRAATPGEVGFAGDYPGRIQALALAAGQSILVQRDSFLCAQASVTLNIAFTKRLGAGFVGGEGFILEKLTGPGTAFIHAGGD